MVYGVIYVITNLLTGMKYVGQTTQPVKERFRQHYRRKESLIGQAMRDFKIENFTIEVIEECETQEQLNRREIFWIKFFNCMVPNGYNVDSGGKQSCYPKVRAKRGSKQNAVHEKKFYTRRKWDAYPVLEAELRKRFITTPQLAEIWNVSFNRVSLIMHGEANILLEQMTATKNFLGVDMSVEELFRRQ